MSVWHFARLVAVSVPLAFATLAQASDGSAAPGEGQSPINIDEKAACAATLAPLAFKYRRASTVTVSNTNEDGHRAIKVNFADPEGAGRLIIGAKEYKLKQFHFHTPSEHLVKGQGAPIEIHYVHQADDKSLAVVAQLAELDSQMKDGLRYGNGPLRAILKNLPADGKTSAPVSFMFARSRSSAMFEVNDPRSFRYIGSLTTPPYTGGVQWIMLEESAKLNAAQIAAIQGLFSNGEGNARPIQASGGRHVETDSVWRAGAACPSEAKN